MAAKSKDAHLYGVPRAKRQPNNTAIASAGNLAFSSALSSLIQTSTSSSTDASSSGSAAMSRTAPGRQRASRTKDDIFKTHNRNSNKRAAADMVAHDADIAARSAGGAEKIDDAAWKRTKRKMEEKARLYAALKRGDVEDLDDRHMVDFDRKWAEKEDGAGDDHDGRSSSDDDGTADSEGEGHMSAQDTVEFVDEFGRTRRGTRAEAAREARRRTTQAAAAADEPDRFTARPTAPSKLIFGDAIQAAAFNPDRETATQMEALASKRDRELTPPEAVHYDANAEIRSRGTGFFQFSRDEDERQKQMRSLDEQRQQTERVRDGTQGIATAREQKLEQRRKELEARRKVISEKRDKMQADRFLDSLGSELAASNPAAAGTTTAGRNSATDSSNPEDASSRLETFSQKEEER